MSNKSRRDEDNTASVSDAVSFAHTSVRGFHLNVVRGPDAGKVWESRGKSATIGFHRACDLVLTDSAVSRFHCQLTISHEGAHIRDLGSRNHTFVDGVRTNDAFLKDDSLVQIGRTVLRFRFLSRRNRLPLSTRTQFGSLLGRSAAMRGMFAMLERATDTDVTVLFQGETGTGKSATARALHDESKRNHGPFVTLDCAAIPANLLESELFGQEKGAFTGASHRKGAFEEADGGTIFLDEIGEMSLDLQGKFLGALEDRCIRRLGSNVRRPIDVRVIAATNRDLRVEVNRGGFREDLFFRLAVLIIDVPPLRQRLDDIPDLVAGLLTRMGLARPEIDAVATPELLDTLVLAAWPGNVRELRNYLERHLLFRDAWLDGDGPELASVGGLDAGHEAGAGGAGDAGDAGDAASSHGQAVRESSGTVHAPPEPCIQVDTGLPYTEARKRAMARFTRLYLNELLHQHGGKVARAATAAGVTRTYLYKLLSEYGTDRTF